MTRCAPAASDVPRELSARGGGWVRAGGVSLVVLGLAAILARSAGPAPALAAVVAHYSLFAGGISILLRTPPGAPRQRQPWAARWFLVGVVAVSAEWLPHAWGRLAVTVFGAAIEEYVFRFAVPWALAACVAGRGTAASVGALLLAQVLFAACHFVPHAPVAAVPFGRLVAAGLFLSVSYRVSGTLLAPVALHAWVNTRLLGIGSGIL